jgi:hypothetical protein
MGSVGQQTSLPPGTYEFVISGEDFHTRRVKGEVLPGVTTVLMVSSSP